MRDLNYFLTAPLADFCHVLDNERTVDSSDGNPALIPLLNRGEFVLFSISCDKFLSSACNATQKPLLQSQDHLPDSSTPPRPFKAKSIVKWWNPITKPKLIFIKATGAEVKLLESNLRTFLYGPKGRAQEIIHYRLTPATPLAQVLAINNLFDPFDL
jgi:hypothetical protein